MNFNRMKLMKVNLELIGHEMTKDGEYILTIRHTARVWRWVKLLFGIKSDTWTRRYIGSCTVWHFYPSFNRVPTDKEAVLSCFWHRLEHERENA